MFKELKGRTLQGEANKLLVSPHLIAAVRKCCTMIGLLPKNIYEIIFYIQSHLFLILMRQCFSSTELDDYFQQQDNVANEERHQYSFFVLPYESLESNAIDAYVGKYFHCILYNNKGRKCLNHTNSFKCLLS